LGAGLGFAGLFGINRSRATAIMGILLGLVGVCLFVGALQLVRQ
jgi:Ca2+/H+ antiporter